MDDVGVDVVKTGMLASTETIEVVTACLLGIVDKTKNDNGTGTGTGTSTSNEQHTRVRLVVDPVMIATTGAALLPSSALRALRGRLFPLATVVTPNVPEARLLLKDAWEERGDGDDGHCGGGGEFSVESVEDLERMARALWLLGHGEAASKGGPQWVLVKGGHTPFRRRDYRVANTDEEKQVVVDVLLGREEEGGGDVTVVRIETAWMDSRNTHGTGCSLACELSLEIFFFPFAYMFQIERKRVREKKEKEKKASRLICALGGCL